MIRCIAFDAVGTVIEPDPPVAVAYCEVGARYGSRRTIDEVRGRFRSAFAAAEQADLAESARGADRDPLATSEAIEHRRWRTIVTSVLDDADDAERCFEDLWNHFARPTAWRCYAEVRETLEELERAGMPVVIASNFDSRLHTVCDGLPPLNRVVRRVVSSECGWRKPSPRFFEVLARAAACRPDEILVVGDDFENDVQGALAAGLQAVWLQRGASSPLDGEDAGLARISDLHGVLERIREPRPVRPTLESRTTPDERAGR